MATRTIKQGSAKLRHSIWNKSGSSIWFNSKMTSWFEKLLALASNFITYLCHFKMKTIISVLHSEDGSWNTCGTTNKLQSYYPKVIVLAVSREWSVFHINGRLMWTWRGVIKNPFLDVINGWSLFTYNVYQRHFKQKCRLRTRKEQHQVDNLWHSHKYDYQQLKCNR